MLRTDEPLITGESLVATAGTLIVSPFGRPDNSNPVPVVGKDFSASH